MSVVDHPTIRERLFYRAATFEYFNQGVLDQKDHFNSA